MKINPPINNENMNNINISGPVFTLVASDKVHSNFSQHSFSHMAFIAKKLYFISSQVISTSYLESVTFVINSNSQFSNFL